MNTIKSVSLILFFFSVCVSFTFCMEGPFVLVVLIHLYPALLTSSVSQLTKLLGNISVGIRYIARDSFGTVETIHLFQYNIRVES